MSVVPEAISERHSIDLAQQWNLTAYDDYSLEARPQIETEQGTIGLQLVESVSVDSWSPLSRVLFSIANDIAPRPLETAAINRLKALYESKGRMLRAGFVADTYIDQVITEVTVEADSDNRIAVIEASQQLASEADRYYIAYKPAAEINSAWLLSQLVAFETHLDDMPAPLAHPIVSGRDGVEGNLPDVAHTLLYEIQATYQSKT